MVRFLYLPPVSGAIAQMGERLPCKQEVAGSIPAGSTSFRVRQAWCRAGLQNLADAVRFRADSPVAQVAKWPKAPVCKSGDASPRQFESDPVLQFQPV